MCYSATDRACHIQRVDILPHCKYNRTKMLICIFQTYTNTQTSSPWISNILCLYITHTYSQFEEGKFSNSVLAAAYGIYGPWDPLCPLPFPVPILNPHCSALGTFPLFLLFLSVKCAWGIHGIRNAPQMKTKHCVSEQYANKEHALVWRLNFPLRTG